MAKHLSESEAREEAIDNLRRSGFDKATAEREGDASVGRVFEDLSRRSGLSKAEQVRRPNRED